jgi:predicted metallo-beta-lactamase superfamily hydrolase
MSKIFYDHLVVLEEVRVEIDKLVHEKEEKEELWNIIDELMHHRIFDLILSKLHFDHHSEFLKKLYEAPYNDDLLTYLKEKVEEDVEAIIINEVNKIKKEILKELNG